jgi:aryl-alcohol dehydrogenase-like predicted oxidoreductase
MRSSGSMRSRVRSTASVSFHLAVRWVLDQQPLSIALWGARHPDQLDPVTEVMGWKLDSNALMEIDRILSDCIRDPVGPEFMAPPTRFAA